MSTILPTKSKHVHLAIVGAGLAGLSCATVLGHAGVKVELLEKSRGVAGRMSTRRESDWQCDHGARYFTARDPDFQTQLRQWEKDSVASLWNTPIGIYENSQWLASPSRDLRYVGAPRMTAPAQHLAKSLTVNSSHTITHINHVEGRWHLTTEEHGYLALKPDWLVIATPAPQALQLTQSISPAIRMLHDQSKTQGCWTMMLRFDRPISMPFEAAFINEGILSWIARNNAKPLRDGPEVWVIHGQSQWSEEHMDIAPEIIAPKMIAAFMELGGPMPADYRIHRWRYASSDPHFQPGFHIEPNHKLGFCGDWLHGGRVEGAWLSGKKLAEAILLRM